MMANASVRESARAAGVPLYAIANELGVSESTFFKWLRFPLTEDREQRALAAIQKLKGVVA